MIDSWDERLRTPDEEAELAQLAVQAVDFGVDGVEDLSLEGGILVRIFRRV